MESKMEAVPESLPKSQARPYLAVFIALAVLTLLELGVTYLDLPRIPLLVR
jgi:hypothetical protein